jgi:anti-sigma factor (TIGR02949 family)
MPEEDCRHLLSHLSDYIDGEATSAICAEIEQHLEDCEDCQVVVDTLRQTVELYHTLPRPDMPKDLRERMYTALDLKQFYKAKG